MSNEVNGYQEIHADSFKYHSICFNKSLAQHLLGLLHSYAKRVVHGALHATASEGPTEHIFDREKFLGILRMQKLGIHKVIHYF